MAASSSSDAIDGTDLRLSSRKLFLRDSLIFFVLLLATVALYAVTSFLFRSFTTRREQLAQQFAAAGQQALLQKQPDKAVEALRTALEYAPDDRGDHLLLAEGLAEAHRDEEATNYFLSLYETEPADGFINLELARLSRQKGESARAIDFYRAAALGNWEQNGVAQRLQAQLELAEYLIELGRLESARVELLTAAGNAPDSVDMDIRLGNALQAANDPVAALVCYRKAVKLEPHNFTALSKAGREAYETGDYADARRLLEQALREQPNAPAAEQLSMLSQDAARLLQLSLGRDQPARERAAHIRAAAAIAKRRLDECSASFPAAALPQVLQSLKARWQQKVPRMRADAQDMVSQDEAVQLIFDTEVQTSQSCGGPSGDDALLLRLAKTAASVSQGKP